VIVTTICVDGNVSAMLYPDSETLQAALAKYFKLNGLPSDGGVTDKWARYKIGPFQLVAFPNFQHRVRAIARHDLHHIINNLDTSALGEGLIAAWELGSGCGPYWISWCMEPQALWWGILLAPKKTFALYLLGRHSQNLFHCSYDEALRLNSVGELRASLLPADSQFHPTLTDFLVFVAVASMGLVLIALFIPTVFFFSVIGLAEKLFG
jgi:hypothetical protein